MKKLTDKQLTILLFNGNEKAFNEVLKRYRTKLLNHVTYKTRDPELAKDIIQDAFTSIWEKRDSITPPNILLAYLRTIVNNGILNHYRRNAVNKRYMEKVVNRNPFLVDNADHAIRTKEQSVIIEKAIAELPENQRIVFTLTRREYMNRQQISKLINMPENSIKSNLQRALARLRKQLK